MVTNYWPVACFLTCKSLGLLNQPGLDAMVVLNV